MTSILFVQIKVNIKAKTPSRGISEIHLHNHVKKYIHVIKNYWVFRKTLKINFVKFFFKKCLQNTFMDSIEFKCYIINRLLFWNVKIIMKNFK